MVVNISIGITIALVGIGMLGILFAGLRKVFGGQAELKRIIIMLIPAIIFLISYLIMGTSIQAGIATMVVMVLLMVVSIFFSGTRGTFKF